jgi:hypothetical protein
MEFEMLDFTRILIDGGLLMLIFMVMILAIGITNPRLMLNKGDIPDDILAAVPPKTEREKRLSRWWGIPLIAVMFGLPLYSTFNFALQNPGAAFATLYWHTFLVTLMPNLGDLVILDWFLFCTITPRFLVYVGTEGFAGYKDYGFHLRGHLKALPAIAIVVAGLAGMVRLIT